MDKNKIDPKDAIILQQMELIRSMTENNLRRMGSDFFGKDAPDDTRTPGKIAVSGTEKRSGDASLLSTGPSGNRDDSTADPPDDSPKGDSPETGAGVPPKADKAGQDDKDSPQQEGKDAPAGKDDASQTAPSDGGEAEGPPPEDMADLQRELDGYIGLAAVKEEVRNLINLVTIHRLRKEKGLPETALSLHMVFTGNPGTGKTTIARLMARIYHSLGILSKGQLIEVDRGGLVAGYVGQTAIKTGKVIEEAMGGVLFIDEAYALSGKGENDFGQEAIDTLLKAMEDHRDDLIVIVAGYDDLMDGFIHSNPGLESRFNRFLHFDDYTTEELLGIFRMRCDKGCYTLSPAAEEAARRRIEAENGPSFGNGRGVRNLFERTLIRQANRLAALPEVTKEQLMEILPEDLDPAYSAAEDTSAPSTDPANSETDDAASPTADSAAEGESPEEDAPGAVAIDTPPDSAPPIDNG